MIDTVFWPGIMYRFLSNDTHTYFAKTASTDAKVKVAIKRYVGGFSASLRYGKSNHSTFQGTQQHQAERAVRFFLSTMMMTVSGSILTLFFFYYGVG